MLNFGKFMVLAMLGPLASPAWAQTESPGSDPEEAPGWFTVELIVFEHSGGAGGAPPPDPIKADPGEAVRLERAFEQLDGVVPDAPPPAAGSQIPLSNPLAALIGAGPTPDFLPVPQEDRAASRFLERLKDSRAYRVLAHLAWRQRAAEFGAARPVHVAGGRQIGIRQTTADDRLAGPPAGDALPVGLAIAAEPEPIRELEGTAYLTKGRFLHFGLDLVLREHAPVGPFSAWGDSRPDGWPAWRLRERRQVQPGELHYFDHHRLGALVLVREWKAEPTESGPAPSALPDGHGPESD